MTPFVRMRRCQFPGTDPNGASSCYRAISAIISHSASFPSPNPLSLSPFAVNLVKFLPINACTLYRPFSRLFKEIPLILSFFRFRVTRKIKYSATTKKARCGIRVKWKGRQRQAHPVNEQDNALRQHQSAEPRDGNIEPSRPNHHYKIPAADQREGSRCHAQPVIKHPVINNCSCTQALQCLRCC